VYSLQPQKGNFELLSSFRLLEPNIRFSEEETRNYDIKQMDGGPDGQMMVAFNKEVAEGYTKEVKVPARVLSYLVEKLEEMEAKGELTFQFMSLYERLVLGKKENGTDSSKQSKGDNGK
jgi:hypothetical protein